MKRHPAASRHLYQPCRRIFATWRLSPSIVPTRCQVIGDNVPVEVVVPGIGLVFTSVATSSQARLASKTLVGMDSLLSRSSNGHTNFGNLFSSPFAANGFFRGCAFEGRVWDSRI